MILLQVDYYDFMTLIAVVDFYNAFCSTIAFPSLRPKLRRIRIFVLTNFQYLWLYWVNCPSFCINYFFFFFEPFIMNF
jgi:hypothetical protein